MPKFIFFTLGMFTVGSSSFMMAGLLPEIAHTLSLTIELTAQGITAFGFAYLISAPFFSFMLANISPKKRILVALTIFLLGNIMTITAHNLMWFYLARLITGVGAGIFIPLCVSIAVQNCDAQHKGKTLSLIWGANSAGVVFGVPLAVFLANRYQWQWAIFYVITLTCIILIGLIFQKIDWDQTQKSTVKIRLQLLKNLQVLKVILITTLTTMASLGFYSYVSGLKDQLAISLSLALFFWGLGGFFGSSSVGHLVDKSKRPKQVMGMIILGLAISIFSIPFCMEQPVLIALSFFTWGAFGWATPTPQQHILFSISEHQKTLLSALNSSAIGMGSTLGTALGGLLISSGLKITQLALTSVLLLIFVFILQVLWSHQKNLREVIHE